MKNKLNKIIYNIDCEEYVNINLLDFIKSELVKINDKIWNYRDNIVLIERDNILYYWSRFNNKLNIIKEKYFVVPIEGYVIYKNINIFSQNNDNIANKIYSLILDLLDNLIKKLLQNNDKLIFYGIGGEFYIYFRILKFKYKNTINFQNKFTYNGYSNNRNELESAQKNNSCTTYNLINYNNFDFNMNYNGITLINLSKINRNIITNLKTEYVISITCKDKIINCHNITIKKIFNLNNVKITLFKII